MSDLERQAAVDEATADTAGDVSGNVSTDGAPTVDEASVGDDGVRARTRVDLGLLGACFVIACGLFAIIWGVTSAITGSDGIDRPDAIEDLSPVENAQQVFQQEQVRVDLQSGYEGVLIIDGVELPITNIGQIEVLPENDGQQLSVPPTAVFDPGSAVITFRPSDDGLITTFAEGRHQAQVIFWLTEEGRDGSNTDSYRWNFEVV